MFSGRLHRNETAQAVMTHPWSWGISFHDHLALDQFFHQALDIGLDLANRRQHTHPRARQSAAGWCGRRADPRWRARLEFRPKTLPSMSPIPAAKGHNQQLALQVAAESRLPKRHRQHPD